MRIASAITRFARWRRRALPPDRGGTGVSGTSGSFNGGWPPIRFQTSGMPSSGAGFEHLLRPLRRGRRRGRAIWGRPKPFGAAGHAPAGRRPREKGRTVRAKLPSPSDRPQRCDLDYQVGGSDQVASLRASRTVRRSASKGLGPRQSRQRPRVCRAVEPHPVYSRRVTTWCDTAGDSLRRPSLGATIDVLI